jgi:hypothetical protein
MTRIILVAVVLAVLATSTAEAATRCRSSKMGSTTYLTCEGDGGKTECRSFRVGAQQPADRGGIDVVGASDISLRLATNASFAAAHHSSTD